MNYQKLYERLIAQAQNRLEYDGYTEAHHIIPKCMGGGDEPENMASLTAREHFVVHWVLTKIYPHNYKLRYAFHLMFFPTSANTRQTGWHLSKSRTYEFHKKQLAIMSSERLTGVPKNEMHKERMRQAAINRWKDPEQLEKQSERMKGNTNGLGVKRQPLTEEIKQKISSAVKQHYKTHAGVNAGKSLSDDTKAKISATKKANPHQYTEEQRKKISARMTGRKQSDHQKKRVTEVNSATWEVITPSGEVLVITNLRQYCLEHKIHQGNLITYGHTKGYKARKIS